MPRKIIQISTVQIDHDYWSGDRKVVEKIAEIFALCDDGTVWLRTAYSNGWQQVEDIPQE